MNSKKSGKKLDDHNIAPPIRQSNTKQKPLQYNFDTDDDDDIPIQTSSNNLPNNTKDKQKKGLVQVPKKKTEPKFHLVDDDDEKGGESENMMFLKKSFEKKQDKPKPLNSQQILTVDDSDDDIDIPKTKKVKDVKKPSEIKNKPAKKTAPKQTYNFIDMTDEDEDEDDIKLKPKNGVKITNTGKKQIIDKIKTKNEKLNQVTHSLRQPSDDSDDLSDNVETKEKKNGSDTRSKEEDVTIVMSDDDDVPLYHLPHNKKKPKTVAKQKPKEQKKKAVTKVGNQRNDTFLDTDDDSDEEIKIIPKKSQKTKDKDEDKNNATLKEIYSKLSEVETLKKTIADLSRKVNELNNSVANIEASHHGILELTKQKEIMDEYKLLRGHVPKLIKSLDGNGVIIFGKALDGETLAKLKDLLGPEVDYIVNIENSKQLTHPDVLSDIEKSKFELQQVERLDAKEIPNDYRDEVQENNHPDIENEEEDQEINEEEKEIIQDLKKDDADTSSKDSENH
eukprot:TRINITY_DN7439_c0_g1_i1.p1 TRINITY_DN7439_c0_g1~~TRINITY_DN7439_c0_g1_i1.p1  ORF type:complete len:505 (+),score=150.39 TRINITY_DN7439_c0_g1_i1:50-1564(+)